MVEGDGYGDGNRDGAARVWIIGQISLTWDPHALLTAFGRGGSHNVQLASAANGRRAFSIAHSDQPALRNFYQFAVTAEVETSWAGLSRPNQSTGYRRSVKTE
ncbi:hypothetical protein CcaCcLH18_01925 [Colletotrichum camelliae]|nr:hypothetical protein CcaCcLH18_01925 [Colletotrichum camelliae]